MIWELALVMAAANIVGGYVGARVALARGAGFVRIFFLVVVSAFIVRIGGDLLGLWGRVASTAWERSRRSTGSRGGTPSWGSRSA